MTTYISILRGINVSGHRKVEMAGLKVLFQDLEFEDVVTYIQSGNIIFKTADTDTPEVVAKKIEQAILKKYNYQVPVIIRTAAEMATIIAANPFLKETGTDVEKLHVTFLSCKPPAPAIEGIQNANSSTDKFVLIDKEIFLYCPGGYGNTKLNNNFFESRLKVTATTRNWKTVNKLFELANKTG